jgi:SAM-dependent methyltransferase
VCITNYDFSDNASHLKDEFNKYFHTILIDSSSPAPPTHVDISIPNTYYPGLWNASVEYAISKKYKFLMFVASDVQINNVKQLCEYANEATKYENIGVYTPSISSKSRTAYPILNNRTSSYIRECGVVEGFFFMANTEILKTIFPLTNFKYGWAVDVLTCDKAYELNRICVVDDRIEIFHPTSKTAHSIDAKKAEEEWVKLIGWPVINRCRDRQQQLNDAHKFVNKATSLDLGCGGKIRNPFLAEKSFGIDLIEDATKGIVSADLIIEKIPFPDSSFEYCTAFDFIEHVPRIIYCPDRRLPFVELMNEIHRILKPGGIFLSLTPAYPANEAFQDPTHVNFITSDTFLYYFCNEYLWAKMYGFTGNFKLLTQKSGGGKLKTYLRAIKD